jgi:hypothetical protein
MTAISREAFIACNGRVMYDFIHIAIGLKVRIQTGNHAGSLWDESETEQLSLSSKNSFHST